LRERERERERERKRKREKEKEKERKREREKEKERERERERESSWSDWYGACKLTEAFTARKHTQTHTNTHKHSVTIFPRVCICLSGILVSGMFSSFFSSSECDAHVRWRCKRNVY